MARLERLSLLVFAIVSLFLLVAKASVAYRRHDESHRYYGVKSVMPNSQHSYAPMQDDESYFLQGQKDRQVWLDGDDELQRAWFDMARYFPDTLASLWSKMTSSDQPSPKKQPNTGAVDDMYMRAKIRRGLDELSRISQKTSSLHSRADAPVEQTQMDYTKLVNPFIGTGATMNPGNVFPGASVPFGMAKFGIDVETYAPAGYNDNMNAPVRGLSLLHDSGTGSSSGSYGNFESLPLICSNDNFELCPITLDNRMRMRAAGKDAATPGYFTTTLNNTIQLETTTTRRAGLIRYTWPDEQMKKQNATEPFVVFDWTNDLPGTFRGGEMRIDPIAGRMTMNGSWASSFGSGLFTYRAFVCYDLLADGAQQIGFYGLTEGDRFGQDAKVPGATFASQQRSRYGGQPPQRGALISWNKTTRTSTGPQVSIRAGVSYISSQQACQNAEEEIPAWDFDAVRQQSKALWNEKLRRLQIANETDATLTELVYTSFYRSFLSPNNATLEAQGLFEGTASPYFDGLYCTWDTFRTFFPFLSLTSPDEFAQITETYIDGWRKQGFIPECRANNVPGFTQGGSDGTNVLADFAVKYRNLPLGVNLLELYEALVSDATTNADEFSCGGRQIGVYEKYGYIPFGVWDLQSIGPQTREGSRTLEYAFNDFGIRNVALLLGRTTDAQRWTKRALNYKNVFDTNTRSLGFDTFVQRRYVNGTFGDIDPTTCSPNDSSGKSCSLQQDNVWTVYETSSFEYSLFAPHDFHGLIQLLTNGSQTQFVKRLDTFFEQDLFYSGNEPSFQAPVAYAYANQPSRSVERVRDLVFTDFNTTNAGLPGNDDNAAMATLLLFHLLGLYPIPSTREFLVVSPFVAHYTLFNTHLGSVTFTARNFDKSSLNNVIPSSARAYVKSVTVNVKVQSSRCKLTFDDLFPAAATSTPLANAQHTDIIFDMTTRDQITDGCGPSASDLPSSMSTGGFDQF